MYHQVKLFLLTRLQEVVETYSTRFLDILRRRLSTERFALVTLLRNLWSGYKIFKSELFECTKSIFFIYLYEVTASTNKDTTVKVSEKMFLSQ